MPALLTASGLSKGGIGWSRSSPHEGHFGRSSRETRLAVKPGEARHIMGVSHLGQTALRNTVTPKMSVPIADSSNRPTTAGDATPLAPIISASSPRPAAMPTILK